MIRRDFLQRSLACFAGFAVLPAIGARTLRRAVRIQPTPPFCLTDMSKTVLTEKGRTAHVIKGAATLRPGVCPDSVTELLSKHFPVQPGFARKQQNWCWHFFDRRLQFTFTDAELPLP